MVFVVSKYSNALICVALDCRMNVVADMEFVCLSYVQCGCRINIERESCNNPSG